MTKNNLKTNNLKECFCFEGNSKRLRELILNDLKNTYMPKTTITGKTQLIDRISKKVKLTKSEIDSVITNLLEETKKSLLKGEEIRLQGYFSFKTTITKPRMAMNLQTKKKMKVPSKRVPKCKFSISLKEEISQKIK
jgi:nucleoid DNA-binding protein